MKPCCSLQSLQSCSFWVPEKENSCKTARTATANRGFHLQESTKKNIMNGYRFHLQKYRLGSKTVCPECGRKSLLHPLYRRGGRDFLPRQCGQVRPHQQLRLPLYAQRIFPGQSYRQREVGRTRKGWPGKVGSEDSTGTGAKNILSSL